MGLRRTTQAKEAAGDKNVYLMGGADTANQALRAGLAEQLDNLTRAMSCPA